MMMMVAHTLTYTTTTTTTKTTGECTISFVSSSLRVAAFHTAGKPRRDNVAVFFVAATKWHP